MKKVFAVATALMMFLLAGCGENSVQVDDLLNGKSVDNVADINITEVEYVVSTKDTVLNLTTGKLVTASLANSTHLYTVSDAYAVYKYGDVDIAVLPAGSPVTASPRCDTGTEYYNSCIDEGAEPRQVDKDLCEEMCGLWEYGNYCRTFATLYCGGINQFIPGMEPTGGDTGNFRPGTTGPGQ